MSDYSAVLGRQATALERIAQLLELHPEIKFHLDLAEANRPRRRDPERCSFCGRGKDQWAKLLAGPGVYICDSCTTLCAEILADPLVNKKGDVVPMEKRQ